MLYSLDKLCNLNVVSCYLWPSLNNEGAASKANMEPALANFDESFEDGDDFDDSKLPSSGYEYLRRVQ